MVGIDIQDVKRVEQLIQNQDFAKRVFFDEELEYAYKRKNPAMHLTGFFCVKESVVKAVGQGVISEIKVLQHYKNKSLNHFGKNRYCDGLAERADVIFTLMHQYPHFDETELYANFRDDVVRSLKERLKRGHILLNGTNATLFGNGTELLKYLASEDFTSELKPGQIRCERFGNGTKLLCARSPHITMGNLYCVENALSGGIWDYFDLGENIVCVNSIGENIQQRLNGCDYDSDTMLITDDKLLVNAAARYKDFFKVPVGNIKAEEKTEQTLSKLDHDTSVNKIGEIVNLSQKLNSILWDELHKSAEKGKILSIYEDICKLAVLSGLEIDKAKRSFENISVSKELTMLRKKYQRPSPNFFAEIDESRSKQHAFYHTAMDDLYALVNKVHFRKGREQYGDYLPISSSLAYDVGSGNATEYRHKDKIVQIIDESKAAINRLYLSIRTADEQEREVLYEQITDIKAERDRQVTKWLTNENVLILVLRHYEKNSAADWRIYAAFINHPIYIFGSQRKSRSASTEKESWSTATREKLRKQ